MIMKILYLVPYTPNLVRVRPYELLRALVQRHHQVTLATLWNSAEEEADLRKLAELGIDVVAAPMSAVQSLWNCLCTLPTQTPLQAVHAWQPRLAGQLVQLLRERQFDIIQVEHLRGAQYGLHLRTLVRHQQLPLPIIWDSVDSISSLFRQTARQSWHLRSRLLAQFELKRTQRYEGHLVHQFDRILVTSATDQNVLVELAMHTAPTPMHAARRSDELELAQRITVLPNGVDAARFSVDGTPRRPATIVFSGKMSYHANIAAALYLLQEIMPPVWVHYPHLEVQIVGKDPAPQIRALASHHARGASLGRKRRQIVVTGTVPEISTYLRAATIVVAPLLYGAGIQNKVLEAMACGAPVIASTQAASGIHALPQRDLLVAANTQEFVAGILYLLSNEARRLQLGQAGRRYVEQNHAWGSTVTRLEAIYQEAKIR